MASLDEQLAVLKSVGIKLNPSASLEEIVFEYGGVQEFEDEPYYALLSGMGQANRSDQVIHQDTECIEGENSYVAIAQDMSRLTDGALPLEAIEDRIGEHDAILRFKLHGQYYEWNLQVDNDWVDTSVFNRFVELLSQQNTDKRFAYGDLGGQDFLISCLTPNQLEALNRAAGFEVFTWLV